jgi:ribokinase
VAIVLAVVLAAATILGGIAAVWYLKDEVVVRYRNRKNRREAAKPTLYMPAFGQIQKRLRQTAGRGIDVLTLSANNYDTFIKVDKIQAEYESVVTHGLSFSPGGSGANTVYALAKLGKRTAIAGAIGTDLEGAELLKSLSSMAVNTDLVLRPAEGDQVPTGRTTILVDALGHRQIMVFPGINNSWAKMTQDNSRLSALRSAIGNCRILHLSSFAGNAEMGLQARMVQELPTEIILSFTPGAIYTSLGLDRLEVFLRRSNVIFLYIQQLDELLKTSPGRRFDSNLSIRTKLDLLYEWRQSKKIDQPLLAVVKDNLTGISSEKYISAACGSSDVEDFCAPEMIKIPRLDIHDTTGTGDALAAGVLYGLLQGNVLYECADSGFIMANLAASGIGAREGLPTKNTLEKLRDELTSHGLRSHALGPAKPNR